MMKKLLYIFAAILVSLIIILSLTITGKISEKKEESPPETPGAEVPDIPELFPKKSESSSRSPGGFKISASKHDPVLGEGVIIRTNSTGKYVLSNQGNMDKLSINSTNISFIRLDDQNQTVTDSNTSATLCEGSENCTLPDIDYTRNISFGPRNTTMSCALGTGIVDIFYDITVNLSDPPNATNPLITEPVNQTSSIPLINCTNTGTIAGQVEMRINATLTNLTDECGITNTYSSGINLTASFQDIGPALNVSLFREIWCRTWLNSTDFGRDDWFYELQIT